MVTFFAALEKASANILVVESAIGAFGAAGAPRGRLTVRAWPVFTNAHLRAAPAGRAVNSAPAWSEIMAAMSAARRALDRARRLAREPGERARLDADDRRFRYGELTFALYDRVFRLAGADRGTDGTQGVDVRRALAEADSIAAGLRAIRGLVHVAGEHADARDGLEASHVAPTLAYFHERFGRAAKPAGAARHP